MTRKPCNDPYPHKDHTWVVSREEPSIAWQDQLEPIRPFQYDEYFCPGVKRRIGRD